MYLQIKYFLVAALIVILYACGGDQQVPKELKQAIANISGMDEAQTETEQEVMSKSISVFKNYANQGNATAMYWLSEARLLDSKDINYITVVESLKWLEKAAKKGHISSGLELADIYSSDKTVKDSAKAYFWYYIGYYKKDGLVHSLNEKKEADPVAGDFRNESGVNELVKELGIEKLKEIEKQARQWLAKYPQKLKEYSEILKN